MSSNNHEIADPGPDETYWNALNQNKFMIQCCDECGKDNFPPSMSCRNCGNTSLNWQINKGKAQVYSSTTVRTRTGNYNVAIIQLDTGARMLSHIDNIEPEKVHIGQKVQFAIIKGEDPHVIFTPIED